MLNSRASCALGSPAVARCRRVASLLIGQGFLAAPVRATLLGQGDALTLPLADQGALELSEGPITDSIRLAIGESSPVNTRPSFRNSDAHAALSQLLPSDAGHRGCGPADPAVHHHCLSPSRTKLSSASSWGRWVSCPMPCR